MKRVRSEEAAQQQSVSIAKSAFGPRVNAFAGWEADNPTFVAGGGGNRAAKDRQERRERQSAGDWTELHAP